jgi:hypothetical protein
MLTYLKLQYDNIQSSNANGVLMLGCERRFYCILQPDL